MSRRPFYIACIFCLGSCGDTFKNEEITHLMMIQWELSKQVESKHDKMRGILNAYEYHLDGRGISKRDHQGYVKAETIVREANTFQELMKSWTDNFTRVDDPNEIYNWANSNIDLTDHLPTDQDIPLDFEIPNNRNTLVALIYLTNKHLEYVNEMHSRLLSELNEDIYSKYPYYNPTTGPVELIEQSSHNDSITMGYQLYNIEYISPSSQRVEISVGGKKVGLRKGKISFPLEEWERLDPKTLSLDLNDSSFVFNLKRD